MISLISTGFLQIIHYDLKLVSNTLQIKSDIFQRTRNPWALQRSMMKKHIHLREEFSSLIMMAIRTNHCSYSSKPMQTMLQGWIFSSKWYDMRTYPQKPSMLYFNHIAEPNYYFLLGSSVGAISIFGSNCGLYILHCMAIAISSFLWHMTGPRIKRLSKLML